MMPLTNKEKSYIARKKKKKMLYMQKSTQY